MPVQTRVPDARDAEGAQRCSLMRASQWPLRTLCRDVGPSERSPRAPLAGQHAGRSAGRYRGRAGSRAGGCLQGRTAGTVEDAHVLRGRRDPSWNSGLMLGEQALMAEACVGWK